MAKIKVLGKNVVIKSEFKFEEIQTLEKFMSEYLAIKEDDGEIIFEVGTEPAGRGFLNVYGALFVEAQGGAAVINVDLPDEVEDAKRYILDTFSNQLKNLNEVEERMSFALEIATEVRAEIEDSIEIL